MSDIPPPPQPPGDGPASEKLSLWRAFRRTSTRVQVITWVVVAFVAFIAIGALGGGDKKGANTTTSTEADAAALATAPTTTPATSDPATTKATPVTPPPPPRPAAPAAPAPSLLTGTGQRVIPFTVRSEGPLVVTGVHHGSANFIVDALSAGSETDLGGAMFNEIGSYSGQYVWVPDHTGKYRMKVMADGPWTLRMVKPETMKVAAVLPGKLSGKGSQALVVRTNGELNAIVAATHSGQSNFIVNVVGFGETEGDYPLYNEIGRFSGETTADFPGGKAIVAVTADGAWTLRFTG